jgi:Protein of unknown function (DUF2938)
MINLIAAIGIGLGATVFMDGWALFLRRAFNITSLNFCLLGRWLLHMPDGVFRHENIAAASPKPRECTVGWIAHYSIGATLAVALVALAPAWLERPTVLPALLWGIVTVVMPFFVLQPSFGLGIASSRTPHPARARLRSLMTHTVYGIGLYLSALAMGHLLRVPA